MKPSTTQRVAANVRAALAVQQIKGAKVAEDLGWSRATVSRRLSGEVPWSVDDLEQIATYLGINVLSLMAERPERVADSA